MTRFVTYDAEVAARLAQAVGVHRVELRDVHPHSSKINPALIDAIRHSHRCGIMMPSSDEQVLMISVTDDAETEPVRTSKKRKKHTQDHEIKEVGTQPSGFLGLQDEPVFSEEPEDPPRSLWKQDE
ncbi:hypothetical protein Acid345_1024 [Candidatus Koribacter versatilis Ellin345]|uniref:Uncharacterized protein n=1 Tax=Koribacter versatilis (strain Ellin345) TaxID=204669 RepID=Q1ISX3_KORVE|nr:hypothetical protein [Candidatus Koribacter versatilis]ABF40027.1 hypothetical protein Acid345_1024 [Candidatus Koribacter versatilis Ellin345]